MTIEMKIIPELPSHPFPIGRSVVIHSRVVFGRPFIEGRAQIIAPILEEPDYYWIQFVGDARIRARYVHPESQDDPDRFLKIQFDIWRASMTPEVLLEFFPDDVPGFSKEDGDGTA